MNIDFITRRRRELGLTVQELAERSGVPIGTVSKISAGINSNPKLETMRALAATLNCSLDDFDDVGGGQRDEFRITETERQLLLLYRQTPTMHEAIHKLLGMDPEAAQPDISVKVVK